MLGIATIRSSCIYTFILGYTINGVSQVATYVLNAGNAIYFDKFIVDYVEIWLYEGLNCLVYIRNAAIFNDFIDNKITCRLSIK